MTYGWAILVVLVVIGALSYFGVLSPATLLPEKCTFPVSMSCVDHQVLDTQVKLLLQNGAGRDMDVQDIHISADALGDGTGTTGLCNVAPASPVRLRNGERFEFTIGNPAPATACTYKDTGRDKNKYNITVRYNWVDSPTLTHSLTGELLAKGP